MSDGVLMIDSKGSVTYINTSAALMLDVDAAALTGRLYANLLDSNDDNSDFHQFVLDAVYDKEKIHKGVVAYKIGDERKKLSTTTSYIESTNLRYNKMVFLA